MYKLTDNRVASSIMGILAIATLAFGQPELLTDSWQLRVAAEIEGNYSLAPRSLAYDAVSGDFFVLASTFADDPNFDTTVVLRIDPLGTSTEIYSAPISAFNYSATDMVFDPVSRNIAFFSGGVERINLRVITEQGALVDDVQLPYVLDAMAVSPSGDLYLGGGPNTRDNNIYRFDLATGESDLFVEGIGEIGYLDFSPDGNLYVQSYYEHENIHFRIDPQGNRQMLPDSAGFSPMAGDENLFLLRSNAAPMSGLFVLPHSSDTAIQISANPDGITATANLGDDTLFLLDSGKVIWEFNPVPEPSTSIVTLAALAVFISRRARRGSASTTEPLR